MNETYLLSMCYPHGSLLKVVSASGLDQARLLLQMKVTSPAVIVWNREKAETERKQFHVKKKKLTKL